MSIWSVETKDPTYREQHNGHGQRHSGEDSHSDTQDQSVIGIDAVVRMQQLRLHLSCMDIKIKPIHKNTFTEKILDSILFLEATTRGSLQSV